MGCALSECLSIFTVCFYVTQAIEEPFVSAVKEALGDRFTPTMEVIYRKTIKFILTTLTTAYSLTTLTTAHALTTLTTDHSTTVHSLTTC